MARLAFVSIVAATLLTACGAGGTTVSGPPVSGNPAQVQVNQAAGTAALALLNEYRAIGSLPPVALDANLCKGCQLHANYLYTNTIKLGTVGLQAHTETVGLPGYSQQGALAGQNSVIYEGVTPSHAIHNWMQTLYHRLGMMDPNITRI